jgi:hypothetical protein
VCERATSVVCRARGREGGQGGRRADTFQGQSFSIPILRVPDDLRHGIFGGPSSRSPRHRPAFARLGPRSTTRPASLEASHRGPLYLRHRGAWRGWVHRVAAARGKSRRDAARAQEPRRVRRSSVATATPDPAAGAPIIINNPRSVSGSLEAPPPEPRSRPPPPRGPLIYEPQRPPCHNRAPGGGGSELLRLGSWWCRWWGRDGA